MNHDLFPFAKIFSTKTIEEKNKEKMEKNQQIVWKQRVVVLSISHS